MNNNSVILSSESVIGPGLIKTNKIQCVQLDDEVNELRNCISLLKPAFYSRLDWMMKSWTVRKICSFSRSCRFG